MFDETPLPEPGPSEAARQQRPFYVTGGTVPPDADSYIERQADEELLKGLMASEYCYVLNTRQMGKSSLSIHASESLTARSCRTVFLDLTNIGAHNLTADQWYASLLAQIGQSLGLRREFITYWKENGDQPPVSRLFGALREIALSRIPNPIILFVDEIDAVRSLPFSTDEFFAAIRACYNGRSREPSLNRLTFCLLGVATPTDLIADHRISPFNIGLRISLTDFTFLEAEPLARHLPGGHAALRRVLHWTGGHPYLTQKLCRETAERGARTDEDVDRVCDRLFLSRSARDSDNNLAFVRDSLLRPEVDHVALLDLYRKVRAGRRVPDDDTNPLCAALRLSGVCRISAGCFVVRNRIYEQVFDTEWVLRNMPDGELRRQREAFRRGVLRTAAISLGIAMMMGGLIYRSEINAAEAERNADQARKDRLLALQDEDNLRVAKADLEIQKRTADENAAKASIQKRAADENAAKARAQEQTIKRALKNAAHAADLERAAHIAAAQDAARARRAESDARQAGIELKKAFKQVQEALHTADASRIRLKKALADAREAQEKATQLAGKNNALADQYAAEAKRATDAARVATDAESRAEALAKRLASDAEDAGRRLYASHLQLLQIAWDNNEMWKVAPLLEATRPGHENDFEWAYWRRLYNTPRAVLGRSGGSVARAAFSPDGQRVITSRADGSLRLWDPETGKLIRTMTRDIPDTVEGTDASLSAYGSRLIAAEGNGSVSLWDTTTGHRLTTIPTRGDPGSASAVAFSPGGTSFAFSGPNGSVRRFDSNGRHELTSLTLPQHRAPIRQIAWSGDGIRLLAVGGDDAAVLWDTRTAAPLQTFGCRSALNHMGAVALSRDGKWIAVQEQRKDAAAVYVRNTASAWETCDLKGDMSQVVSLCLSPDGRLAATGERDGRISLWNARTGQHLATIRRHSAPIRTIEFSPDGSDLVTGDDNGLALLVSARGTQDPIRLTPPVNTPAAINNLFCAGPDRAIASTGPMGAETAATLAWNLDASPPNFVANVSKQGRVLASTPDGAFLIKVSQDGQDSVVTIVDTAHNRPTATLRPDSPVRHAALSPNGEQAATLDDRGALVLWDRSGKPIRTLMTGPKDAELWFDISDTSSTLCALVPAEPGKTANAQLYRFTLSGLASAYKSQSLGPLYRPLAVSRDGRQICAAHEPDGLAMSIWSLVGSDSARPTPQPLADFEGHSPAVCFSPDGDRIATAGDDRAVSLWDSASAQSLLTLRGHPAVITALTFTPDGRRCLSGDTKGNVLVWDARPSLE